MIREVNIGGVCLANNLVAAPMAGVTDRPFRILCRRLGAGLAVSEMLTADKRLWHTRKSQLRMDHRGEPGPISVQIAGGDPAMLAEAARINVDHGAELIDINMGCPAKKVCNKAAGSALLGDESLVGDILDAVVTASDVPVTLKIRTGPDPSNRNAVRIAKIAESAGIAALSVHGRTRADKFKGDAEYTTVAMVKDAVTMPVFANGDIDTPWKAREVLRRTGADGLMIGRPAQGNPWIFREIAHFLDTGARCEPPSLAERVEVLSEHLEALYHLYGTFMGIRVARKHVGWYLGAFGAAGKAVSRTFNRLETAAQQRELLERELPRLQHSVGEIYWANSNPPPSKMTSGSNSTKTVPSPS